MNISEHTSNFIQEMKRRNYSQNTIDNYASCINVFFSQSKKDHPKNINEQDIKSFLGTLTQTNTQRNYHSAIKKFYDICLGQKEKFKYIPYARKDGKHNSMNKHLIWLQNNRRKVNIHLLEKGCGLPVNSVAKWLNGERGLPVKHHSVIIKWIEEFRG